MRVSNSSLIMATMSLSVSKMVVSEALGLEASVKSGAPVSKSWSVWQCGMMWAGQNSKGLSFRAKCQTAHMQTQQAAKQADATCKGHMM